MVKRICGEPKLLEKYKSLTYDFKRTAKFISVVFIIYTKNIFSTFNIEIKKELFKMKLLLSYYLKISVML